MPDNTTVSPMIIINGKAMPPPSKFDMTFNDLESEEAGRSLDGNLHRDVIGRNFRTIELEWATMKKADLKNLMDALNKDVFPVVYYDPIMGTKISKTMYAGDRKINMYDYTMDEGYPLWLNISVSLMQVFNNNTEKDAEYDDGEYV